MVEGLAKHALFADVAANALDKLAAAMTEESFGEGDWILREGAENSGLRIVLDGEAGVVIGGEERPRIRAGTVFGEISALLSEPVAADVDARTPLRCTAIGRDELFPFLLANPAVTLRLLQVEVRRIADVNRWLA